MPLYEYECSACGHRFERIRKFSDPPVDVCPHCGEPKVQKLLSSPAIQFKGTGWYITDYARSKESKESKDERIERVERVERVEGVEGESKETGTKKTASDAGAPASSSSTPGTPSTPKASGE